MSFSETLNLGNSIIGVSVLAMPYCFAQSGILLSVILIIVSGLLTRLSCHLLLKSAFSSRRRSFELMVQDVLGPMGRVLVEVGLIGFLLGTCVAYFIMIGDIAPKVVAELFDLEFDHNLRIMTVSLLGSFVALPLSLLRTVDSLTSFSFLSMILYICLIFKLMLETTEKLSKDGSTSDKFDKVVYWNNSGLLRTFPIFCMAMSCQTSLFEIFDSSTITNDLQTIKRDNGVVKKAIYICKFVYITIGILGYMAFHDMKLHGNLLVAFPPSMSTTITKIGFIITLLMSFPLCLFPCRTSVYSLTFGKFSKTANFQPLSISSSEATLVGMSDSPDIIPPNVHRASSINGLHRNGNRKTFEIATAAKLYISDIHFKILTVILILVTILLSLMFPHIEFILGIIGSTAGTTVCFILPAYTFIKSENHTKTELILARVLLIVGLAMLIFCSYSTLHNAPIRQVIDKSELNL